MHFRVVIPEHVKAGQTIRIHCPDGTEANVKVPKGLSTGDSFIFEIAADQLQNPQILLDQLNQAAATTSSKAGGTTNPSTSTTTGTTGSKSMTHTITNTTTPRGNESSKKTFTTAYKKNGFLDREIVNLQDFVLALSVGLVIGLGIVLGFLLGILYVTAGDGAGTVAGSSTIASSSMVGEPPVGYILEQDSDPLLLQHQQQSDARVSNLQMRIPQVTKSTTKTSTKTSKSVFNRK